MKKLVLGSSSQSRLECLKKIGFTPDMVISADIDETMMKRESPKNLAIRLAREKGEKVFSLLPKKQNTVVLAGDTVVCVGRRLVDKALSDEDVRDRMCMLSGKSHRIYSGIFIIDVCSENIDECKIIEKCVETRVKFKTLTKADIDQMVATKNGIGKAGGYGIIGFAESFIISMSGSVSNVIGLPTYHVRNTLLSLGIKPKFD